MTLLATELIVKTYMLLSVIWSKGNEYARLIRPKVTAAPYKERSVTA